MAWETLIRAIITIAAVVAIVVVLIRHPEDRDMTVYPDSLNIMKEKYEKGEITKAAYEEQKKRRGIK